MIVTPQSNLQLFKDIPWNNDYKHTRYFRIKSEQLSYFNPRVFRTYTNFTYIREQNVIRIPAIADEIYSCNYLRYMNTGFGDKWFYAFITSVKYINNETTEISFEIDDWQTWKHDIDFTGKCYVEREHVGNDGVGMHVVDENLGTGELIPQVIYNRYWTHTAEIGAPDTEQKDQGFEYIVNVKPTLIGDFISDNNPFEFVDNQIVNHYTEIPNPTSANVFNNFIKGTNLTGAEICDAYVVPYELINKHGGAGIYIDDLHTKHDIKRPSTFKHIQSVYTAGLQDYTPKNNKLLTYPYTYLLVASFDGNKQVYRWENTHDGYLTFEIKGCAYNDPSCSLVPTNYFGAGNKNGRLNDIPINGFPKVTLGNYDSLSPKSWVNSLTRLGGAMVTGNVVGAVSEAVNGATGLFTDTPDKKFSVSGNSMMLREEWLGYTFYVMGISAENAQVIDSYLTRFGYKVNRIKNLDFDSRKYWNYIKTKECELGGNVPNDALKHIQEMLNAGMTFWHVNDVGNFRDENPIIL